MGFRSRFAASLAVALCLAAPAFGQGKPTIAPPPRWVDVAPLPAPPPADDAPAVQTLLDDNQSRLSPAGDVYYTRRAVKVLRPEGLSDLTTESFTWDPAIEDLVVHTIAIERDGKTIDLLKDGKDLLVLRRETGLEAGMLDGRLTATMQIEGLKVGDVLDVAWTIEKHDPATKGRSEDPEGLSSSGATGRYRVRTSWPTSDPVRWRVTAGLPQPTVTTRDGRTTLLIDASDIKAPTPPAGAPFRYAWLGRLYATSFSSWKDVSGVIDPLFEQAATLSPSSPLRAEAAAIAASTTDPKARAFEALKLVEDKVRYFYIGTNDGGYVPASADETWRRRFGDCKGKTVVLLALLRQLGIDAEPALVSTRAGDGMDQELPGLLRFDHVLIRADIGGRVYWLDGTRLGDVGGIDELEAPAWRWALPLRPGGEGLERIVQTAMEKPMMDVEMHLDASKGLDVPAPARFRLTMRGDMAVGLRLSAARASKDDLIRMEKQAFANSVTWFEPKSVDWKDEPQNNAFVIDITGQADMYWRENPDLHVKEFRLPGSNDAAKLFPIRDPGPEQNAPFTVAFPFYVKTAIDVVLPDGGRDFSVSGPEFDETIGEYHLVSTAKIVAGVARFDHSVRTLAPEVSAADATAANKELRRIDDGQAVIRFRPDVHTEKSASLGPPGA